MTIEQSVLLSHLALTVESAQATLPWPTTGADGVDITSWRRGGPVPRQVFLEVKNVDDIAVDLSDITLAVHYGAGATDWASVGLVTPDAVTIQPGSVAYLKAPVDAATLGDRWAFVATVAGTTPQVTVRAIPLEVMG